MKKVLTAFILGLSLLLQSSFAIEDDASNQAQEQDQQVQEQLQQTQEQDLQTQEQATQKKQSKLFQWFKKPLNKNSNKKQKTKKARARVQDIKLPPVIEGRSKIPFHQLSVMSIDDCVNYAIEHNPNLLASAERVKSSRAGVGIARSNYAPRLTAKVSYHHINTSGTRVVNSHENNLGFNAGISDTIWDFGRTTAKINMAKYNTLSATYDHDWELLNVVYAVKINYYKVLLALADLDIFEQNVRIQTLNYERTKAMFDEGLKSKIDVVNAEVNLTDAKIKLVEGRNKLETSIIDLQNVMFYQEDTPFIVENTETFNFLKADYKQKVESLTSIKPPKDHVKTTKDGLIMLSSGIEHLDIIKNFEFNPFVISKSEAVKQALEFRPDLKSNEMLANVQEESLKAIKRQYTPELTTDLTWGYTKTDDTYNSPLQLGASFGVGSVNPYGIHYQTKQAESLLDIALHNVNIAKTDIFWEVQTHYVNMRQLERKIPLMNSKVKATLENFELADGRYSVGLNNYVELQDALKDYNEAQLNFVEAVFNYNVARETLLKSMGVK